MNLSDLDIPVAKSTICPEGLGDKGQRYEVRSISTKHNKEIIVGYSHHPSGGSLLRMAALSDQFTCAWVVDRKPEGRRIV